MKDCPLTKIITRKKELLPMDLIPAAIPFFYQSGGYYETIHFLNKF